MEESMSSNLLLSMSGHKFNIDHTYEHIIGGTQTLPEPPKMITTMRIEFIGLKKGMSNIRTLLLASYSYDTYIRVEDYPIHCSFYLNLASGLRIGSKP